MENSSSSEKNIFSFSSLKLMNCSPVQSEEKHFLSEDLETVPNSRTSAAEFSSQRLGFRVN